MRDKRILLGMLLSIALFFGGACAAGEKTLSLDINVTPELNSKTSGFDTRITTTYDDVTSGGGRFFVGAVNNNAKEHAVSMLTTPDLGVTITRTALAPALIYATPNDTANSALVANPVYNARIWELSYFACYGKFYIAAIVQTSTDTGKGGSILAVINVVDPKETYISATATTLENEVAGTAGSPSRFVKLAVGDNQAVDQKIVFCAVADPTTGEFDTSKSTVGLRAFTAPKVSLANNALVELDMNSAGVAATKGVALGASAQVNSVLGMTPKMRKLTSLVWDTTNKVLYLGGWMADGFTGLCAFYLAASNVLTTLNHSSGGTIINNNAGNSLIPELSNIHSINITKLGTSTPHLIIQSGTTPQEKNRIFALPTIIGVGDGTNGKLSQGDAGYTTPVALRTNANFWLSPATNGVYTAAAMCIVGNSPFYVPAGGVITSVSTRGTSVYVTTWNAKSGSEAWSAVLATTGGTNVTLAATWNSWKKIPNTALTKVTGFGTNGTYVWAVLDRKSVYVKDSTATPVVPVLPTLGANSIKDTNSHARLRQVVAYDTVKRQLLMGATGNPDANSPMTTVQSFTSTTGASADAAQFAAISGIGADAAIWDMVTMTNGGNIDRYYLIRPSSATGFGGGTIIVRVPGDGSTVTAISASAVTGATTSAAFFQDGSGTLSKCIKLIAGQKTDGTPLIFCLIPDASSTDGAIFVAGTSNDRVKGLNPTTLAADGTAYNIDTAFESTISQGIRSSLTKLQCAYFDPTAKRLYLGYRKSSGSNVGMVVLSQTGTTITGNVLFGTQGSFSNNTIKDIQKITSLRTKGTTPRTILVVASTLTGDAGDTNTAGIYALPIFVTSGRPAQATDYTVVATDSDSSWNVASAYAPLFRVGALDPATTSVSGRHIPWHLQAIVVDMQVVDQDLYVTIANPQGVNGATGVFRTTALSDASGNLTGWTPWVPVAGLRSPMQNVAFDTASASVLGLDLNAGQPQVPGWKDATAVSQYDQLAQTLNDDFADKGGVYNIASHTAGTGIVFNDHVGTGIGMNMVVATGNKKVALAYTGYKSGIAIPQTFYNPTSSDIHTYKLFNNDAALNSLGQIYCSTMSRGVGYAAGWIFVGGQNGVAVLRRGSTGNGWTTTLPTGLQDTTSSGMALADMTWLKIPGITGPINELVMLYDRSLANQPQVLLAAGPSGVWALPITAANVLDDDTTTNPPVPVQLSSLSSSERVWDIAPLYRRAGVFLVATTKGLYRCQFDNGAFSALTAITDPDGAAFGPISSISVSEPVFASGVNPTFTVDCVTAKARTDSGKHYRFTIQVNETTGAHVATSTTVLVKTLDRMVSQIITDGATTVYHAGKPTGKQASVDVVARTNETTSPAVSNGMIADQGIGMGRIAIVGVDGTKLVTVGGRVYVQSV